MRRVVVTGMGMVCGLGLDKESAWSGVLAGQSAARSIDSFDAAQFSTRFTVPVAELSIDNYLSPRASKRMDRFVQYGMVAGIEAFEDSGIVITEANADRVGVCVGSGIGGVETISTQYDVLSERGARKVSPFLIPASIVNMISGNLSIHYGLQGPNYAISTACATGTHSIGEAARSIQYGDADVMLAGGSEFTTSPITLAGFCAARALSTRNEDPQSASRPWDKNRDGFVMGDGAGVLVLEEYEHAKSRGARIYCELKGYGCNADAYHITQPAQNGKGARLCMQKALSDAAINADRVDYINAHGTSTLVGDMAELAAVCETFAGATDNLAMSSTKSMTGHLLGAAGAVEAIFCALAIRDQVAPPTINIEHLEDEARSIDIVVGTARDWPIGAVMSNSFGFGGTNASIVLTSV